MYFRVGMSTLSLRYGAKLPHTGLPKFMHAAGDDNVRLRDRHVVALQPQLVLQTLLRVCHMRVHTAVFAATSSE